MTIDLAKIKSDAEKIAANSDLLLMALPVRDVLWMLAEIDRVYQQDLEIANLQLALTLHDDAEIQGECVRMENRRLLQAIQDMCSILHEIRNSRDWNGSISSMAKRIDGMLIKNAKPPTCEKCGGTESADSGGVHPWGEQIMVICDCVAHNYESNDLGEELDVDPLLLKDRP